MRTLIGEMAKEKAIVISTHILEEVEAVCTRAAIIAHGRLLADSAPESAAVGKLTWEAGRLDEVFRDITSREPKVTGGPAHA